MDWDAIPLWEEGNKQIAVTLDCVIMLKPISPRVKRGLKGGLSSPMSRWKKAFKSKGPVCSEPFPNPVLDYEYLYKIIGLLGDQIYIKQLPSQLWHIIGDEAEAIIAPMNLSQQEES